MNKQDLRYMPYRRSMSWPEFWHHFGNRWLLKFEPHIHDSKFSDQCSFCALDSQSCYWSFSDRGVIVTGGELIDAPKWAGLNTPTSRTIIKTHTEALTS